ncbi:hypothetical protein GCM10009539_70790 [Cryptosporangium japonicum]|uniref:Restriction endonuclease type IV Mrr domain-containing protein n=2 Tax=Cryptosporangium japonicum TaxID=80872 RepID=A0ABN0V3P1_9ACTN
MFLVSGSGWSLIVAPLSLLAGGLGLGYLSRRRPEGLGLLEESTDEIASEEFIANFAKLESRARDLAGRILGEPGESLPLDRALSALLVLPSWTDSDTHVFRRILALRNALIHDEIHTLSTYQLTFGMVESERLLRILGAAQLPKVASRTSGPTSTDAFSFENRVRVMLISSFPSAVIEQVATDGEIDLVLSTDKGSVGIIVKYKKDGILTRDDIQRAISTASKSPHRIALITNAELSDGAREWLLATSAGRKRLHIMRWSGDAYDRSPAEAIGKIVW